MTAEKIEPLWSQQHKTVGLSLLPEERTALMTIASEAHRSLRGLQGGKTEGNRDCRGWCVGSHCTSGGQDHSRSIGDEVGDPRQISQRMRIPQGLWLELKEKEQRQIPGRLRITKSGSGRARQYLWLAVSRGARKDAVVQLGTQPSQARWAAAKLAQWWR